MSELSIILGDDRPDLIREETIADIFRQSVKEHPDKIALIFHDQTLTYAQLDNWSDAVAVYLNKKGIARGSNVGVWWQRGFELHAAILGIVKAGATYVPVDREIPAERVEVIMEEVGAAGCFSMQKLNIACKRFQVPARPDEDAPIKKIPNGPEPTDCAYVLYTSGSTGKPKGIPISHKQICHLIRSEQTVIGIRETDKVYQGFSVSFDMWCEETWISYYAGATLWVADNTTSKAIDELSDTLNREQITILHAVPSLLAVIDDNVPSLRFVNAGGEACTPQVLAKWAKPGITFYNSYGPTETTVTSNMANLHRGDSIQVGKPLPNYNMAVVDEQMNIVPFGEAGELVITGPGVASGYVKLPELTKQKFIPKPKSLEVLPGNNVYRTGDSCIISKEGTIDILGRFDDQIKLRGYRIELGEIEVKLNQISGVASAVVAVKKDGNGQDQLVGYVVTEGLWSIDEAVFRMELAKTLPSYMVPGVIMTIDTMPRMPSGKINRKALPVPQAFTESTGTQVAIDMNAPVGDRIIAVLKGIFPNKEITPAMDFFDDLGGHSLLAAGFVSQLRRDAGLPGASLKDVYLHRPLSKLIGVWESQPQAKQKSRDAFNKVPLPRYLACWSAQTVALLLIYGLFAFQIFIPYLGYYYIDQETNNVAYSIATSLVMFALIPPIFTFISIATKWVVIGKMKEGDYPLWGSYYFKWWFVKTLQNLLPAQFLNGTPLYPMYLRMLGMTIAADAQISDFSFGAPDLITIGSDASLSSRTNLNNAFVEDGMLKLRKITIGEHAYIGTSASIAGDSHVKDWGELQDLSMLPAGKTIGEAEVWKGSPAQFKEKKEIADLPHPEPVTTFTRRKYKLLFLFCMMTFPFVILLPLLPTIIEINRLDNAAPDYNFNYIVNVPVLAIIYIFLFAMETILLSRLLQRGIKPGKYSLYSLFYVRKWYADQLMSLSLIVLHPIYATVYISSFFRMLGAKIGKKSEISTASGVTHPLLSIGDGAFIADAVTLGESDIRAQQLILDNTSIDSYSFVGNSALIPQGYHLNGNMLIGVLSTPPDAAEMNAPNASKDWFGSPAIPLPRRQESNPFPPELTLNPSLLRKLSRAIIEFIRIILPESAIICSSIFFIAYGHDLIVDEPLWKIIILFPFYYLFFMGGPAFLITVMLKWLVIGKYKVQQKPMWSWAVWKSEAITTTYEALAIPFFLEYLQGTPWLPVVMRLLGVKIGHRVWMNTTDITEFDMVTICDDAALNEDCGPQTHLFEDRVMKVGTVKIGARSSIGAGTIILYDSELGDDTKIEALSLVMKGERLAPGTDWIGSPVKPG